MNSQLTFRKKKARSSRSCVCVPTLTFTTRFEPTRIINTNILYAHYNDRTNLIQINAVIPDHHYPEETTLLNLFKFMYTVRDNEVKQAIQFCQDMMDCVYKGNRKDNHVTTSSKHSL